MEAEQDAPAVAEPVLVSAIADPEAFEAVAERWDALVRRSERPTPFVLYGFLAARFAELFGRDELLILCAWRGSRLVAAIPLVIRRQYGIRIAELLSGWYAGADFLLADDEPVSTLKSLLDQRGSYPFAYLRVYGLKSDAVLLRTLPGRSSHVLAERNGAPVAEMPDGWEVHYRSKTTSKRRGKDRRALRDLGEQGHVEFTLARTPEDVADALEEAFRLHDLRWRGRADDHANFTTPEGRRFHRAAARTLAEADVARIVVLRVAGRAIAFHYYFALGDTMFIHRLAFDPQFASCSPGVLATLRAMELASDEGLSRIEFLRGEERYKLQLADRVEPLSWATALERVPDGAIFAACERVAYRMREIAKRSEVTRSLYGRLRLVARRQA